jgi:hypothetical protein
MKKATWTPENTDGAHGTATAYAHSDGRSRLVRGADGRWTLQTATGEHVLPRRATFDHAEALLSRLASN